MQIIYFENYSLDFRDDEEKMEQEQSEILNILQRLIKYTKPLNTIYIFKLHIVPSIFRFCRIHKTDSPGPVY